MFRSKWSILFIWTANIRKFEPYEKFEHLEKHVFYCFILKFQGFVKIPGYEPVELDLEKLFLLSVSTENLDSSGKK